MTIVGLGTKKAKQLAVHTHPKITGQINYPQLLSLTAVENLLCGSYIQEQNKATFVWASHILPFLYTLRHIFIPLCGRDLGFSIGRARVQNTQCGEISATLAETECSVSSVGVQSKGSFLVFLIIKV